MRQALQSPELQHLIQSLFNQHRLIKRCIRTLDPHIRDKHSDEEADESCYVDEEAEEAHEEYCPAVTAGKPPALFSCPDRIKILVHDQVRCECKPARDDYTWDKQTDKADADEGSDKKVGKHYIEVVLAETVYQHVKVRRKLTGRLNEHHFGSVFEYRHQQKILEQPQHPHEDGGNAQCPELEEIIHVKGDAVKIEVVNLEITVAEDAHRPGYDSEIITTSNNLRKLSDMTFHPVLYEAPE